MTPKVHVDKKNQNNKLKMLLRECTVGASDYQIWITKSAA